MNPELEAILKAYDAFMQARGEEAERLRAVYDLKLEEVLNKNPGVSPELLRQAVRTQYLRWLRGEKTHPSIPPKA